jgi:hypothetical protein
MSQIDYDKASFVRSASFNRKQKEVNKKVRKNFVETHYSINFAPLL